MVENKGSEEELDENLSGSENDGEISKEDQQILYTSLPIDFSFRNYKKIEDIGVEGVRSTRVLATPKKSIDDKYITRSLWLNNNKLKSLAGLDTLVDNLLKFPMELQWIDISFNYLRSIDDVILKFPKLKIIYLHGNCLTDMDEIFKLRNLKELKTVTFQGNPISNSPKYRSYVISCLPTILNLDFIPVLKTDRMMPLLPEVIKKIEANRKIQQKSGK